MKNTANAPKKAGPGLRPWLVTAAALALVIAVGFLGWLQLSRYEKGVLDVYAGEQDGYVRLVLEQIALTEQRGGSQADIEQILATLDASPERYWTLARQDTLIFVRDATETSRDPSGNPRGGFTIASHYQTDSARDFIDTLEDSVTHSTIQMGPQRYIASGARFLFDGAEYRVCLLTNIYSVLNHGAYLTAKLNLCSLALIALALFVAAIELLCFLAGDYRKKYLAVVEKEDPEPPAEQEADAPADA